MSRTTEELGEFDRDLQTTEVATAVASVEAQRGKNILRFVGHLLWGQGAVQASNILANLFLVHRLSIEAYAQFGLAIGFQSVFAVLMDMGFAGTIVPLVADRRDDKNVLGRYVRSASHLRDRSFAVLAPLAAVLFFAVTAKHHWSFSVRLMLLGSVLLSLYFGGTMANFSAPLIIFRELKKFYLPQALFGAVRLVAYLVFAVFTGLSAWLAALLNSFYLCASAVAIKKNSAPYLRWPPKDDAATDREVLAYVLPATPAIIFSAFQAQITLFLVSLFGGTLFIAQVAALSRIGQIFTLIIAMCSVTIEPYVARLSHGRLLKTYITFAALTAAGCLPLVLIAFRWPRLYLWVLGAKYQDLSRVLGWYVLSLSMNVVSSVIWIMNRARKWVFWSGSVLEVVLIIGIQAAFLILVGVRTTPQAVYFSFAASFGYIAAHGYVGLVGFYRDSPRRSSPLQSKGAAA